MSKITQPIRPSEESTSEDLSGIERSDLFHVLRNQRRRFALHHLKHCEGSVDVGDLATQVAAWENEVSVNEVTSKQRRRVYNALKQTHVPKLEETGVVKVERREVTLTEHAGKLDIYLEVVSGSEVPWSEYYLALGVGSLALLIPASLNIGPFAFIPGATAGIFVTVAFLISAATNYYFQHEGLLGSHEKPPELRGK